MSKLCQESDLRLGPAHVALHPSAGFAEGANAILGGRNVTVKLDPRVPPGVAIAGGWPEGITESSKVVRA
jgi:hypothetical protein